MNNTFIDNISNDQQLIMLVKNYFKLEYKNYVKKFIEIMIENNFISDDYDITNIDNISDIFLKNCKYIKNKQLQYDYYLLYFLTIYSKCVYESENIIKYLHGMQVVNNFNMLKNFENYIKDELSLSNMAYDYAITLLLLNFYKEFLKNNNDKYNYDLYKIQEWMRM